MADIYVRNSDGSDSDNGSTWALAKATLAGAGAIDNAGDNIWLSSTHSESTNAQTSFGISQTTSTPVKIVSVNDGAAPPTALAAGATIATTGVASNISISGSFYMYGVTFNAGNSTNQANVNPGSNTTTNYNQLYDTCNFVINNTNISSKIICGATGATNPGFVRWDACNVKFGSTSQGFLVSNCDFDWRSGSVLSGSSTPGQLFQTIGSGSRSAELRVSNVDLSNLGTGFTIFQFTASGLVHAVIRNCKLPAGWSGTLATTSLYPGNRAEMYNCDSGDTNYRLWVQAFEGSIKSDTTVTRTGGATDGDTALSWLFESNTNAIYPVNVLRSPEIFLRNNTVGSEQTLTVEFAQDNGAGALKDEDIWLEVQYLGTSGFPLGSLVRDAKTDILATGADQTTSSVTWSGLTNPTKQKLSVAVTAAEKGMFICTVCLAKANITAYIDPHVTVA